MNFPQAKCVKCGVEKATMHFTKAKGGGLDKTCKECRRLAVKKQKYKGVSVL